MSLHPPAARLLAVGFLLAALTGIAQTSTSTKSGTTPPRGGTAGKSGSTAKGVLPDPALLDGSKQPAEKRPEYGMVGDFELPGDENVRNGKVGGPQNPNQNGQNGPQGNAAAMGLPQAGGAGGAQAQAQPPTPPQAGGGGGPENPDGGAKQIPGGGDPNAKAQGQQVAELQGQGGGPEQGAIGEKPQQVSIGDSAMQIKTVANAPTVVGGQQPAGQTQQHEKTTGSGGKGPTGNNSNKGVERGRAIPAGL